jgi:hypothetical protein
MGLCVSGVSGGLAVGPTPTTPTQAPQLGGVTLSQVNDFATIFINNGANPGGPDISGIFALSGATSAGVSVNVQFVPDLPNWQSGNWQTFNSVLRNDTNAFLNGPVQLPNGTALQLSVINITSLYAVRVLLVGITGGSVLVSGNTNPGSIAGVDQAILSALLGNNTLNKAEALGLSILADVDLLSALGSSF